MRVIHLPLLTLLFLLPGTLKADPVDNIAVMLRQGNTVELAKLFAPTVELTIIEQEDTYSKRQAAEILTKFFSNHQPKHIKLLHKVNSNQNYLFGVLFLTTNKGTYRVAVTLNKQGNSMQIIELRIETEKTK
jgi:hypothetical protein